jgi:hypothetical protein
MNTRTYINKRGLPVLERLIRNGLVTIEIPFSELSSEEIWARHGRYLFCKAQLPAEEIRESIFLAESLLHKQEDEDTRCYSWETRFMPTMEHVDFAVKLANEKSVRLTEVRCLLAALMDEQLDSLNVKYVAALLGESYMMERDFESAHFWLSMAVDGPYFATRKKMVEATTKAEERRSSVLGPQFHNSGEGWLYTPLEKWEKQERLRKRRERSRRIKMEENANKPRK